MKMLELNIAKLNLDEINLDNDSGEKDVETLPGSIIVINPKMIVDIRRKIHFQVMRDYCHGKTSLSAKAEVTFIRISTGFSIVDYLVYQNLSKIKELLYLI